MSGSKEPPHLPEIVDEAGDSPSWLPLVGLALLCVLALGLAARQAIGPSDEQPKPAVEADAGAAAAPAAGDDAKPAAPRPSE